MTAPTVPIIVTINEFLKKTENGYPAKPLHPSI